MTMRFMAMPSPYLLIKKFAVNWQTHYPDSYADHDLLQIQYGMPRLPHCYIICQRNLEPSIGNHCETALNHTALSSFFYSEAKRLSHYHTQHS